MRQIVTGLLMTSTPLNPNPSVGYDCWSTLYDLLYEDRRYYYHILIALDTETGEVKRWTKFFVIEGEKVEYVLGFIQTSEDEFMIGYSKMDKTCCIKNVSKSHLNELFII